MKKILYANDAREMLDFLLTEDKRTWLLNYKTHKEERYYCKGIYRDGDTYIVFDNTTGHCVEESFPEFEVALFWLDGGSIDDIVHLCRCNNCYTVMIDDNPQIRAKNYVRTGREADMQIKEEDGELHFCCPKCMTDAYLIDL